MANWKHDYLDLNIQIEKLLDRYPPVGRVTALLHGYAGVVRGLLIAEVNGGLDECYMEFPDPPKPESCNEADHCYCDLLKQRDDFILEKGLWGEFMASLSHGTTFPSTPYEGQFYIRTDFDPPKRFSFRDNAWVIDGETTKPADNSQTS